MMNEIFQKACKTAEVLTSKLNITYYDGYFIADFDSCMIKDGNMLRSFFGRERNVDQAVSQLLNKTYGTIYNMKTKAIINFATI